MSEVLTRLRAGTRWILFSAVAFASPCTAQVDWGAPAQEEAAARARVDLRRTQIGLPSLPLNAELQTAARGHASYLTTNNLSGHVQNAAQFPSGFTGTSPSDRIAATGYKEIAAADGSRSLTTGEVVARGPLRGENAVESLITAIYHRLGIFGTTYDEQGAGIVQGKQGVTVVNFGSRKSPRPAATTGWVGVYPFDGQAGVSVDFYANEESPRPPVPTNLNRVGYPVSLQIDAAKSLTVSTFTLAPVGGSPLQAQVMSKGGGDANMPASAAALVPLEVLLYGTTYEAKFSGSVEGTALAKTWRFTTAAYFPLAVAGPATVYVGDTLGLKFSGGSGRYPNVDYSFTAGFSQDGMVGDNGFSLRADSPGSISITVTDGENKQATIPIAVKSAAEKLLPLAAGWNLVGNSTSVALEATTLFANASNIITLWKWVPANGNWAFYAPSLGDGGAAYAASKGYDFLVTIGPGDGFWVNAKAAFSVQLPAGSAVSSVALRSALVAGWNLVAVGDNRTPREFNNVAGPPPVVADDIPANVTTLWAWDNPQNSWYFYAPSLDQSGGLAGYTQQKSYLDFGTKTLDPITGFWVNKP